jgi:hypothetical protein
MLINLAQGLLFKGLKVLSSFQVIKNKNKKQEKVLSSVFIYLPCVELCNELVKNLRYSVARD